MRTLNRVLVYFLIGFLPLLALGQSESFEIKRCVKGDVPDENCWATINLPNGQRYVGFLSRGNPSGIGILYFSDGVLRESGRWSKGELVESFAISKSKFPFDETQEQQTARAIPDANREIEIAESLRKYAEINRIKAEIERNRPPQQKIAFCVQTVQSSGTRYPSIDIPYCQDACNKTYSDRMCTEVGGSKWRVQTASPKTSPPNSQYFVGLGSRCACIGQEYVLNEIKEMPAPVPVPTIDVQFDSREAELAKREKALAEREKAMLEAENKRLREELEAERKKKK